MSLLFAYYKHKYNYTIPPISRTMDVIDAIRRGYELDKEKPSPLSECTERALELLADQLYATDTHFLLEFIQNAEDNEYSNSVDPTLRIIVRDTTMTLSCNEIGFSESNVRAICKIGASTKKDISGFIGEKGIGFKSVFKVADVVHVASNCYKFKFDRKARLGMIAPVWDDSASSSSEWTTFHLELADCGRGNKSPGARYRGKMLSIKPSVLLFLKKLRSIRLDAEIRGSASVKVELERKDRNDGLVRLTRVEDGELRFESDYVIAKRIVNMRSLRRRGADESELILAFPVDQNAQPMLDTQEVHAFLPIRKFGFQFIIHGDFLTSSSREDILNDSPWNLAIRDAITDTFIASISTFQKHDGLRDKWIRYLPARIIDPFFGTVENEIVERIQEEQFVKDSTRRYRRPSEVVYLTPSYRIKGLPLITETHMQGLYYLSDEYDGTIDVPILKRMGVRGITGDIFLSGLRRMDVVSLAARDSDWHEAVCSKLKSLRNANPSLRRTIQNLRILPLNDGSWALTRDANAFVFESGVDDIPAHLDFHRIEPSISPTKSPRRYELFRDLGVRELDHACVAHKILDSKALPSVDGHVSNALYFFNHRFTIAPLPLADRLLVVDEHGKPDIGERLYLDLPTDNGKLRRSLSQSPSARFAHSLYTKRAPRWKRDEWFAWLRDYLHLNTAPRVHGSGISREFSDMIERLKLTEVLCVLRFFWPRWSMHSATAWHGELARIPLTLEDGSQSSLGSMYLKRKLLGKYQDVPFVPVDDPDSVEWDFLERLGVTIRVDALFFVKLLIRYQKEEKKDEEAVESIYKQLDARFDECSSGICAAFKEHPLVYVESGIRGPGEWQYLNDTFWDGPSVVTSKVVLRYLYPTLGEFFQRKLGLQNCPPHILLDELKLSAEEWMGKPLASDIHQNITKILEYVAMLLRKGQLDEPSVRGLVEKYPIFPCRSPSGELRLYRLADLYIPDRGSYYAEFFRHKVPLLELHRSTHGKFKTDDQSSILELLKAVPDGLARCLEHSVDKKMKASGTPELAADLTCHYASRYDKFERIVYDHAKGDPSVRQSEALSKLKEISVYTVDSISSTLTLGNLPPITTETAFLQVFEDASTITVYISRTCDDVFCVHLEICKRLAVILDCDIKVLIPCATFPADALETLLRVVEVNVYDPELAIESSWLQQGSGPIRSTPSGSHDSRGTLKQTNGARKAEVGVLTDDKQFNAFSFEGLRAEIDRLTCISPELNTSCFRAITTHENANHAPRFSSQISSTKGLSMELSSDRWDAPADGTSPVQDANRGFLNSFSISSRYSTALGCAFGPSASLWSLREEPSQYQKVNGFLGERYVYDLLSKVIGSTFGPDNWTSELRVHDPRFDGYEGTSVADFKYEDLGGILTKALLADDPVTLARLDAVRPTYHMEVKSTSGGSFEPFCLSKRQLMTALSLHRDNEGGNLNHVYVITRVWNVRNPTQTSYKIYLDPIRCILADKLKVVSENIELMIGE